MRSPQTKFSPGLRALAAITLLIWTGALVICTAHCSLGLSLGHGGATRPPCHGSQAAQSHSEEGNSSSPAGKKSAPGASCLTLKSALVPDHTVALLPPELHLLLALALVEFAREVTAVAPPMPFSRQAQPRDWLLTPEVYLGPAFHSNGPPMLS